MYYQSTKVNFPWISKADTEIRHPRALNKILPFWCREWRHTQDTKLFPDIPLWGTSPLTHWPGRHGLMITQGFWLSVWGPFPRAPRRQASMAQAAQFPSTNDWAGRHPEVLPPPRTRHLVHQEPADPLWECQTLLFTLCLTSFWEACLPWS